MEYLVPYKQPQNEQTSQYYDKNNKDLQQRNISTDYNASNSLQSICDDVSSNKSGDSLSGKIEPTADLMFSRLSKTRQLDEQKQTVLIQKFEKDRVDNRSQEKRCFDQAESSSTFNPSYQEPSKKAIASNSIEKYSNGKTDLGIRERESCIL